MDGPYGEQPGMIGCHAHACVGMPEFEIARVPLALPVVGFCRRGPQNTGGACATQLDVETRILWGQAVVRP